MSEDLGNLKESIAACRICAERFAATETGHEPRPVIWPSATARLMIAGQAPGARVHETGLPFNDRSGDRLREWMGIDRATFYDRTRIAIVPMAFCFPGYRKGSDLPPPPVCARTWHGPLMAAMPQIELVLAVGGYAQAWHIGDRARSRMTDTVRHWREYLPAVLPLPHPSWRNTGWLRRNAWFGEEVLPWLKDAVEKLVSR